MTENFITNPNIKRYMALYIKHIFTEERGKT